MKNEYNYTQTCAIVIFLSYLLTACGGGGGGGGADGSGGLQDTVFASIQSISGSSAGPFSNEIQKTTSDGNLTATWNEPTRALDDSCLSGSINKYIVHYGFTSGQYSEKLEVTRDSGGALSLNCNPSSASSAICSQITIENCSCNTSSGAQTDTKCGKAISSCSCTIKLPAA